MENILLYNTLTRKKQPFTPLQDGEVSLYTCGPTVYDYTHIGHLRKYIGDDLLKRILKYNGLKVKHVMNVTDVGHLVSDQDEGEDKLEVGAKEKDKSVWEVAEFFEDFFFKSIESVNVLKPDIISRATEHIEEQLDLIKKLEEKGFTYKTSQAIYFDILKFPDYSRLSGQRLDEKSIGAREDVFVDSEKKNPQDFALWFFTIGRFANHVMRWSSPWGEGFPGWHIECSAMSMKYLGETIDIHTGGVDHIPVHHTNEIAQSESATGKTFVNYWVHHNFLKVDGEKMSKSKKNFYTINDIVQKGFDPLALRYLTLTTHYRDTMNFTWKSLEAAQSALISLKNQVGKWSEPKIGCAEFEERFKKNVNDDLNLPKALAVVWEMVKSDYPDSAKAKSLFKFDQVLGLGLGKIETVAVPEEVRGLVEQREKLRKEKKFTEADQIRMKIEELGFTLEDKESETKVFKKK